MSHRAREAPREASFRAVARLSHRVIDFLFQIFLETVKTQGGQ